jgi:jacalin-like lectin domain-containing protein
MKVLGTTLTYLALGLTSFFAVTASEARDAGSLGGGGGGEFRSQCPSGHAWFAYIGNAGSALDGIRALCTSVQPDKTTTGTAETDYHGGSGGSRIQRTCAANSVVTALEVYIEANKLVAHINLFCTNLQTGAVTRPNYGRQGGEVIPQSVLFRCNADEIGVGIYGRSGAMVDQIGLICEKLTVVQPALAAQPKPVENKPVEKPAIDAVCNGYGDRMSAMANEARGLGCAFTKGTAWSSAREYWVSQCQARNMPASKGLMELNEPELRRQLNDCRAAVKGVGAQTMKVVTGVTMYNTYKQPNKDLCYLHPGDTLTKLSPDGATDKWLHLSGNSGDCNGRTGYVWNEGELK